MRHLENSGQDRSQNRHLGHCKFSVGHPSYRLVQIQEAGNKAALTDSWSITVARGVYFNRILCIVCTYYIHMYI